MDLDSDMITDMKVKVEMELERITSDRMRGNSICRIISKRRSSSRSRGDSSSGSSSSNSVICSRSSSKTESCKSGREVVVVVVVMILMKIPTLWNRTRAYAELTKVTIAMRNALVTTPHNLRRKRKQEQ